MAGQTEALSTDAMEVRMDANRGPIVALIVVVLLVVGGLWLQRHLRANAQLQDCVMSGRTNCAPIASPARP